MAATAANQQKDREWFVIRCKPHQEELARLHLKRQGYVVYLPQIRTTIRHARRTKEVLRPLFPGYLFLHLAPNHRNWTSISATRGVIVPVSFGEQYTPLPDWVIAGLKEQEESPGVIAPQQIVANKINPGATVEISLSSGETTEATVFSYEGGQNVVVLLNLLQRQVRTTMPVTQVSTD